MVFFVLVLDVGFFLLFIILEIKIDSLIKAVITSIGIKTAIALIKEPSNEPITPAMVNRAQ